jgi:hypothetical protein
MEQHRLTKATLAQFSCQRMGMILFQALFAQIRLRTHHGGQPAHPDDFTGD